MIEVGPKRAKEPFFRCYSSFSSSLKMYKALLMSGKKYPVRKFILVIAAIALLSGPASSFAQTNWATYPKTVYEKKPVKKTRWVDETVVEKKQVTSYKPIWQTEKRERKRILYKPVQETVEREEKITLRKPVVETLYRDKTTEETTYETVTKYRDEEYTVREPVIETEMRTEKYTVRKPVTEKMIEVTKKTTYKPVVKSKTTMVPTQVPVIQLGSTPDPNARPRAQWLERGYYTDPATGQSVFRKRGLHWVQPRIGAASVGVVPALIPQEKMEVSYEPETTEERTPIEVTRYVEEEMTRDVPVEIEKMVERTKTRRVPYEVKVPKTTVTTEKIPYKRTTYKEEVITRKVPHVRTTVKKIEMTEPYEVEVPRWVSRTEEVEVPKTVSRKVEYEVMQDVAKVVMMKVPVDICGNPVGLAMPVDPVKLPEKVVADTAPQLSIGFGSTLDRRSKDTGWDSSGAESSVDSYGRSVIEKPKTDIPDNSIQRRGYRGSLNERAKLLDETAAKAIEFPDTTPSAKSPGTSLKRLDKLKTETSSRSTFAERSDSVDEIVSRSQITTRIPRASQWRSEDPFGNSELGRRRFVDDPYGDPSEPEIEVQNKTLIETSQQEPPEPVRVPAAARPDEIYSPQATGDESAADVLVKPGS